MKELLRSATAKAMKIDNTPPDAVRCNLEGLRERLEVIRIAMGTPLYITSGYRCEKLNAEVGGVPNSLHMEGRAADIYVCGTRMSYLYRFLLNEDVKKVFGIVEVVNYNYRYFHVGFKY